MIIILIIPRLYLVLLLCLLVSKDSSSISRVKLANNNFAIPDNKDWPNYAPYFRFAGKRSSANQQESDYDE